MICWIISIGIAIPTSYLLLTSLVWWLEIDRKHSWWFYFTHPKVQLKGDKKDELEKDS